MGHLGTWFAVILCLVALGRVERKLDILIAKLAPPTVELRSAE